MFNMDAETFRWIRISHFNKNVLGQLESHIFEYKNIELFLKSYMSIKSKYFRKLNIKAKITKLLWENIEDYIE